MEVLGGRIPRVAALIIALPAVLLAWAGADLEFQVKAAFLHNFAKFVEWPKASTERGQFCVGLMGPDPFGETIDEMVKGRTVNGKPIIIRRVSNMPDAKLCQILFINMSDRPLLAEVLKNLSAGTLTIGQTAEFLEAGGMINFIIEDKKVRFEVNAEAARKAGLRIHAQLLKLARTGR